jgi:integrase
MVCLEERRTAVARPPTGQVLEKTTSRGRTYALRFRAYGKRQYLTLGTAGEGWTRRRAEDELANVLADVRRGIWTPPVPEPAHQPPAEEPTFHVLASEWVERRRHEVAARTVEQWQWVLSTHLLPFLAEHQPSQITAGVIEAFKTAKLAEREAREAAIERWRQEPSATRGRMPPRPLSNASINKCLKVLAQVLDDAVEFGYAETNVARGKRRRLKAGKPRRTWLELHEVQAILATAGKHRAMIATMILAGLRVGELCKLRWRDVDLAAGKLGVVDAKTDAGERVVDVSPLLLDELKLHRANAGGHDAPDDLVFATGRGTMRNRSNITRQILQPAIEQANVELAKAGRSPIGDVTNHSLRRTFASLLYEAGASPAYVMSQMGHTDPALALEVYTKVMERKRDTGARMDALVRGADWAPMGTRGPEGGSAVAAAANEKPAGAGSF